MADLCQYDLAEMTYRMTVGNKPIRYIPPAKKVRMEAKKQRKAARPEDQVQAERLANEFSHVVWILARKEKTKFTREAVLDEYFQCCFYCGDDLREAVGDLDHIFPWSKGGTKTVNSCRECNKWKRDMSLDQFRQSRFEGGKFWAEAVIEKLSNIHDTKTP